MLELREITIAYELWQAAGLKPNWSSEGVKTAIERQTLERYKHTDIETWGDTVDYIADNNKYWPTWADINNTLSILRQNKIGAEKKAIERNSKASNEIVKKLFADLAAGKTFGELRQPMSGKVKAAGKRIFPDADDDFIKRNENDISFIADVERKCAECINTVDCPFSGHQPFLRVDKESGFTYVVADRERCYKYHTPAPSGAQKQPAYRQSDLSKI